MILPIIIYLFTHPNMKVWCEKHLIAEDPYDQTDDREDNDDEDKE